VDRQLTDIGLSESRQRRSDCPDQDRWREIADGLTPPEEAFANVEHASRCGYCGPLLRAAVAELAELNGELTEAERKHIARLRSAQAEWQQKLARRITGTLDSDRDQNPVPWWQSIDVPRLAMAGVSLLAVVAVGSWVAIHQYQIYRSQPATAERLLARAYTQQRTLELRMAGADYAPMRVSRGTEASFISRPSALLKAESLIASQLKFHPSDPSWLQVKAQADVLEGNYDVAIESLRRARELDPRSPALLTDLATAYSQRAQQEDRKDDFGAAYEYLSDALKLQPDDPTALFNRGIVAEHLFLYQQALDDWDHYLRVDPNSQWADDVRHRSNALRERLKEHESKATPLLSPAQLAALAGGAVPPSEVDQRIEEYLHEAVRSWLPLAFPEAGKNADPHASQALFFLAKLTSQQHHDRWLTDLLGGSSAPQFRLAVNALAPAVQANYGGEYDIARERAEFAERLFRASGNTAGALRAQFEHTYADQMLRHSEDCRRRAVAAAAESERYAYPWVQIQLGLEENVCSALMGDLGRSEKAGRHALDWAQRARYDALYLRAEGFVANGEFLTGNPVDGWKIACAGLKRYWSEQLPRMPGFNLYSNVALAADAAGQPNLQLAILREAVALIDPDNRLLWRAMAHRFMADAATAASQPQLAEQQYAEAAWLFAAAPRTEASRDVALEVGIQIARLEARQGRPDDAIARLTEIQDQVRALTNNYLAQIFYSTLGEVQLRSHHEAEAEKAFRPALRLAEQNLASLTSDVSRMSWSRDVAPIYLGLAEAELVQGREQESLDIFEWYMGAPQRVDTLVSATSRALPDPSLLPARLPLLSHQTVLAFGLLPDGLAIWAYDNRGVTGKWIPQSPQELQNLAASFYAQCSDPGSERSALRQSGQALYSLLIAPAEHSLDPKRILVIEAEGFLARLPFEAFVDANGHYLIERGPIVHSPGPHAEARLHPETAISPHSPALIVGSGASWPDAGVFPDPNVPSGADTVASGFHHPLVLKGREATLGAVQSAIPAAAVFHFAGHAIATPNHDGLMLEGTDARTGAPVLLDADVVRKLNLQNMQLAVLAACSTDSGEGGSRGFDSVAEALQISGVPHVVASRWAVDSVQANAFVAYFYRSVLSGQAVSVATRWASETMLSSPRTSHPYYWSAFAAYGIP